MKRVGYLLTGIVLGALLTTSGSVFANALNQVQAWYKNDIQLFVNGHQKQIPTEYGALIYENRTYLPVRLLAESIGSEVSWDETSNKIFINNKEKEQSSSIKEGEDQKQDNSEEVNEENNAQMEDITETDKTSTSEDSQPQGDYKRLPVSRYFHDMELRATLVAIGDTDTPIIDVPDNNYTRVFVELKNKGTEPLELLYGRTEAIVDGKKYTVENIPVYQRDRKWFDNIYDDDNVTGYITLPLIPKDSKKMKLTLYVMENSWKQEVREIVFDIEL